jgi:mannose-6-phosphate isomerase-like protein (cupin superfamily)
METTRHLQRRDERETLLQGPVGALLALGGADTDGAFSLVEHPLSPRALGAFVHTHENEDEYTYVLDGIVGFEIDGKAFEAGPGDLVVKPRRLPHAFWNAADVPARVLELIVPGGFEGYFSELGAILGRPGPPDLGALAEVARRYGLEADLSSIERLASEHELDVGGP